MHQHERRTGSFIPIHQARTGAREGTLGGAGALAYGRLTWNSHSEHMFGKGYEWIEVRVKATGRRI